jgi:hypothetical protein
MMQAPSVMVPTACIGGSFRQQGASSPHSCHHGMLRPQLRFGWLLSTLILVADSVLRFSWMLRFVSFIFPHNDGFVLCTQFLEVFRRGIWNLLRVEWESIKQKKTGTLENKDHSSPFYELKPLVVGDDGVTARSCSLRKNSLNNSNMNIQKV